MANIDYRAAAEGLASGWALTKPQEGIATGLTCGEANDIAQFFKHLGMTDDAESWIEAHAYGDGEDDLHHGMEEDDKAATFVREEL